MKEHLAFLTRDSRLVQAIALASIAVAGVAVILGSNQFSLPNFTTPRIPDTADYTIDNISIVPPPPGQPGQGTIEVVIRFTLHANTGNISPMVWLYEHDIFQNLPPDLGSPGELGRANPFEGAGSFPLGGGNYLRTSFTLTCGGENGDEVIGPNGKGTGEGHWVIFPPQVAWDDAEIRAVVARQDLSGVNARLEGERQSLAVDMSCAQVSENPDRYLIQHSPAAP